MLFFLSMSLAFGVKHAFDIFSNPFCQFCRHLVVRRRWIIIKVVGYIRLCTRICS